MSDPPKAKMPRSPRAEWRLDMARMAVQDVLRVEPEKCRGCNGTMVFYGRRGQEKRCPTCDGTGKHYYTRQDYVETMRTDEVTWKRWEWLYREMVTILKKMT